MSPRKPAPKRRTPRPRKAPAKVKAAAPTAVAFLRAVNVGGKNTVPMSEVQRAVEALGFAAVKTVGHAGNILFDGRGADAGRLASQLARGLERRLGLSCEVVVRHLDQLRALAATLPFGPGPEGASKRYVAFLARAPATSPRLPLTHEKEALELFALEGLDVLLWSHPSKGRHGFPNLVVEKLYGVPATTRNWNTVLKLTGG
jgi:uncharacterized protein (DUF1697 family)